MRARYSELGLRLSVEGRAGERENGRAGVIDKVHNYLPFFDGLFYTPFRGKEIDFEADLR